MQFIIRIKCSYRYLQSNHYIKYQEYQRASEMCVITGNKPGTHPLKNDGILSPLPGLLFTYYSKHLTSSSYTVPIFTNVAIQLVMMLTAILSH